MYKEKAALDENVWSEWMKNDRITMDYRDEKLEPQFMSMSAYLQASMKPKDHRASVFFTAADVKYARSVVFMVATPSELHEFFSRAQNLKLAAVAEENSKHGIWRAYLAEKRG